MSILDLFKARMTKENEKLPEVVIFSICDLATHHSTQVTHHPLLKFCSVEPLLNPQYPEYPFDSGACLAAGGVFLGSGPGPNLAQMALKGEEGEGLQICVSFFSLPSGFVASDFHCLPRRR